MLIAVHDNDGYPVNLPPEPKTFLDVSGLLGAWVAEDLDSLQPLVGHVILRERTQRPVMMLASRETGLEERQLAVIGRLLVAPTARRRGIGVALLDTAAARARELGRQPILDVVVGDDSAIALYEHCHWKQAGEIEVTYGEGHRFRELVYIGPSD